MTVIDQSVISAGARPNLFDGFVVKPFITHMPVGPDIIYTREADVIYNSGFYGEMEARNIYSQFVPLSNLEVDFISCVCDTGLILYNSYNQKRITNANFRPYVAPIQLPTIDELVSSFQWSNPSNVDFRISGEVHVMSHGTSLSYATVKAATFEFTVRNGEVTEKSITLVGSVTNAYAFSEDLKDSLHAPAWAVKADLTIL